LRAAAKAGDRHAERQLVADAKASGYASFGAMWDELLASTANLGRVVDEELVQKGYGKTLAAIDELRKTHAGRAMMAMAGDKTLNEFRAAYEAEMPAAPAIAASLDQWFDYYYGRKELDPRYQLKDLAAACGRKLQTVKNYHHEVYKPSHPRARLAKTVPTRP